MKVWLDDLRNPLDPYYQKKYGAAGNEVWVKSVEEAITLLKKGEVESISLDNDLGKDENGNNLPEGYEVACWIEEQAFEGTLKPLEVYAHSDNSVANPKMRQAIANAYRFWSLLKS